jgi:hypothetical protein
MGARSTLTAATLVPLAFFVACSRGAPEPPSGLPEALKVLSGERLLARARAKGVQVYQCAAKDGSPDAFDWNLTGPEAELTDDRGEPMGVHLFDVHRGGPAWNGLDDSKVVGAVKNKVDAPNGAIPWLLLSAKHTEGTGVFSKVTHIQRVDTEGGNPPAEPCSRLHKDASVRVPYSAVYYFYGR